MSLQMVLKDNTAIDIVESGLSGHIVMQCADQAEFDTIWTKLSSPAVEEYTIVKNGDTVQTVAGASLSGTQTLVNNDGTLTGHFYIDGDILAESDEYATVGRILMGEEE